MQNASDVNLFYSIFVRVGAHQAKILQHKWTWSILAGKQTNCTNYPCKQISHRRICSVSKRIKMQAISKLIKWGYMLFSPTHLQYSPTNWTEQVLLHSYTLLRSLPTKKHNNSLARYSIAFDVDLSGKQKVRSFALVYLWYTRIFAERGSK